MSWFQLFQLIRIGSNDEFFERSNKHSACTKGGDLKISWATISSSVSMHLEFITSFPQLLNRSFKKGRLCVVAEVLQAVSERLRVCGGTQLACSLVTVCINFLSHTHSKCVNNKQITVTSYQILPDSWLVILRSYSTLWTWTAEVEITE